MIVETDTPEAELVAALRQALDQAAEAGTENEANTITTKEYIEASGVSEYRARRQLAELCEARVLVRDYIARVNPWGDRQRVKGYRYVGGE